MHKVSRVEITGKVCVNRLCENQFKDRGIGFEQKYADKIFGIFKRLDSLKFIKVLVSDYLYVKRSSVYIAVLYGQNQIHRLEQVFL